MKAALFLLPSLAVAGCFTDPVVGFVPSATTSPSPTTSQCGTLEEPCDELGEPMDPVPIVASAFDAPARPRCSEITAIELDAVNPMPESFECADVTLTLNENESVRLDGVIFANTRLIIQSDGPAEVILINASGHDAYIGLDARIRLHIDEAKNLANMIIDAGVNAEGRALWISNSSVSHLKVRAHARSEVRVERTAVALGVIDVGLFVADASSFSDLVLRATDALFAGSAISDAELDFGTASFVTNTIHAARVARCDELSFFSSRLFDTNIAACASMIYLKDSTAHKTVLRGKMELDRATVSSSTLAPFDHELVMNHGTVKDSAFCDTRAIRTYDAVLQCVSCVPEVAEPNLVDTKVRAPQCPSLEEAGQLLLFWPASD